MKSFNGLALALLCAIALPLLAQVGNWESVPLATEVRDLVLSDDKVLMASDGGILQLDPVTQTFEPFVGSSQLNNLDIHTIAIDPHQRIWTGGRAPGDIIEILDMAADEKIAISQLDVDEINTFAVSGDSMFAAFQKDLDGGILFFRNSADDIQYLDIFENFPGDGTELGLDEISNLLIINGRLVFSTPQAIIWATLESTNLKDPAVWSVSQPPVNNGTIKGAGVLGDDLVVAIDDALYTYNFSIFTLFLDNTVTGGEIQSVQPGPSPEELLVITSARALAVTLGETDILFASSGLTVGLMTPVSNSEPELWMGHISEFLRHAHAGDFQNLRPNMPSKLVFSRMLVRSSGDVIGGNQSGFSILEERGWWNIVGGSSNQISDHDLWDWTSYQADVVSSFRAATVEDMILDNQGRLVASLQGRGVLRIDVDQLDSASFFSTTNGVLEPTFDSETFILPTQLAEDSRGNLWITTKFVRVGGAVLSIITPEGEVYHVNQSTSGLNNRMIRSIAIDANDRVWVGAQLYTELQSSGGIYVLDFDGDPSNLAFTEVATIQGTPLEGTDILQLEIDAQNQLWILTPNGVQSMPLPSGWLPTSDLQAYARLYMTPVYWELGDYEVSSMEIDRRGNRWFLTSDAGVHVLQSNGVWMNGGFGFHTGNSGILDDLVYSAAFDAKQGLAYLATQKGLSVLRTPFADPREDYETVFVYPQPFNPDKHSRVIVQGLMDNSSVKIVTMDGRVVRELTALEGEVQGFEARWDGKDSQGDKVGDGVYILFLYNDDGNAATHKLAVLR